MRYKKFSNLKIDIPAIGQGSMGIGGYYSSINDRDEYFVNIIKKSVEYGMTLIDTAEIYGNGHSEEIIGKAISGIRDKVFVATKVSPENLSYENVLKAAERSLRRLFTDHIDLYQIHWPNPSVPIEETLRAMSKLMSDGKIAHVGVSNFSMRQLIEANRIFDNNIASIQIEYNLFDRSMEEDMLQYCTNNGISIIAYSPLDGGRFKDNLEKYSILSDIANRYDKTVSQIVLNWIVSNNNVIAIPKAEKEQHILQNSLASDFNILAKDSDTISENFVTKFVEVSPLDIRVDCTGLDSFSPSPAELADDVFKNGDIKPIRIIRNNNSDCKKYTLVEGKLRYWAWVYAYGSTKSIKAIVRKI